jgi:hypothetical protein
VLDCHRAAICCAAAGEVSLRRAPRERLEDSAGFRQLGDGPPVYAQRRFTSNLPSDLGLRAGLGRLPSGEESP